MMLSLPKVAEPLFSRFSIAFSQPTFDRFVLLAVGAIVCMGRRTTTAVLWTVRTLVEGHASSYHRVFSRSPWRPRILAKALAGIVLELVPTDQLVVLSVDDTTAQHKGKHVYGKGCHHDAVRSTHTHVVWKWGHKWVVLAINVKFSFARRPWALPVLCALYKPAELDKQEARRHRTPIDLTKCMVSLLIRWFPDRKFVLLGDGGYASHDLARFARRRRSHLTLVSLFHADANLYAPPPARGKGKSGRPRLKGKKLPHPAKVVDRSSPTRAKVGWYGGGDRRIEFVQQVQISRKIGAQRPCSPRGFPKPVSLRMTRLKLNPPTCTSSRLAMFSWPRRCVRHGAGLIAVSEVRSINSPR
jgi:hypothetical protein